MTALRVLVVAKRSSWKHYVEESADPHVLGLLAKNDPTVARMRSAHDAHEGTVLEVDAALAALGADVRHAASPLEELPINDADLVLTVGGDGTLLAASHSVDKTPILGVNSAPDDSVGFFCGARAGTVRQCLEEVIAGAARHVKLARMAVEKNGVIVANRVLNDALFCHRTPAATSRYLLELGAVHEEHRSSGFWLGPAAGSTAAQRSAGGDILPFESRDLQLVVREPYDPGSAGTPRPLRLRKAIVHPGQTLVARSKMYEAQVFFDGPHDQVEVARGDVLQFRLAEEPLTVVGLERRHGETA